MSNVTHPAEGIYLPKFWAGIISAVLTAAILGGFTNLWYLNRMSIQFETHISSSTSPNATLPGALSRREWALERQILVNQHHEMNGKLDELVEEMRRIRESRQ